MFLKYCEAFKATTTATHKINVLNKKIRIAENIYSFIKILCVSHRSFKKHRTHMLGVVLLYLSISTVKE